MVAGLVDDSCLRGVRHCLFPRHAFSQTTQPECASFARVCFVYISFRSLCWCRNLSLYSVAGCVCVAGCDWSACEHARLSADQVKQEHVTTIRRRQRTKEEERRNGDRTECRMLRFSMKTTRMGKKSLTLEARGCAPVEEGQSRPARSVKARQTVN